MDSIFCYVSGSLFFFVGGNDDVFLNFRFFFDKIDMLIVLCFFESILCFLTKVFMTS